MFNYHCRPSLDLPHSWSDTVKSAVLNVISLAHYAIVQARGNAAHVARSRNRWKAYDDWPKQAASLAREEMQIKDARMARLPPHERPRYLPTERLAILELKAAQGWSLRRTAKRFQVAPATISSWQRRIDEDGPDALVQLPVPVNKFPQFVGYMVRRLKIFCPTLGKRKIAEMLAYAGLHLGVTTVGRMLGNSPSLVVDRSFITPSPLTGEGRGEGVANCASVTKPRIVTAKRPNHVWHVDLTVAPIVSGFWTTWLPFALPQCWPFCWWVTVVVDHYSRRVMGTASFFKQPTSEEVRGVLGRAIHNAGAAPKHIVCDRGGQFDNDGFRRWCRRRGIRPRYGAIGQHGSIAVVERFILTLKQCCTRLLLLTPLLRQGFQQELSVFSAWYNGFRPHTTLGGRTPDEVYYRRFPANRRPRFEPRSRWPRGSPCANPWALTRNGPGAPLELTLTFHAGRKHLPIVAIRRAA